MRQQLILLMFLLMLASPLHAQWFSLSTPGVPRLATGELDINAPVPKNADGHTDLSGLWVAKSASGTLFDASKIQSWALAAMAKQESSFYANDPRFKCLPSGPGSYPAGMSVGGMRRIVQHPDIIAILNAEMNYRQIFMDGRDLEENPLIATWEGYSVGHWEGDTLVVESNGFNDKTWLTREGLPHTAQLRLIERYQRQNFGSINLEISYDDAGTFIEPVKANIELVYMADSEILEIVCNESETGRSHYNGDLSQAEERIITISDELMQSYAGTYQGIWLGSMVTAEFVIEDGNMVLIRTPRYSDTGGNTNSARSTLVAQSENAFDCSCGLGFIFNADADGQVTDVSEVHVSGAWTFKRVD